MHFNKQFTGTILIMIISLTCLIPVMAETKDDVQQEISALENEQSTLESELADLKATKMSLESYIKEIDEKINEVLNNMNDLSDEIVVLNDEIHTAQLKVIEAKANQAEQYKALSARIKAMYESGEDDYIQILLGVGDLKIFLNEAEYREKINSYDYNLLNQLQETAKQIEKYKSDLESKQNVLKSKVTEYEEEKASLEIILSERESELSSIDANISSMNYDISAIREKIASENEKMERILNEEKRLEQERQAKKSTPINENSIFAQNNNSQTKNTEAADKTGKTEETKVSEKAEEVKEQGTENNNSETSSSSASASTYNGPILTKSAGTIMGPSGKETYYNLDMSGVVSIMRQMGFSEEEYPYWVRDDGCKMLGDYIICAANLNVRPRGTTVESSLGMCLVCDTGGFASYNSTQIDIATDW